MAQRQQYRPFRSYLCAGSRVTVTAFRNLKDSKINYAIRTITEYRAGGKWIEQKNWLNESQKMIEIQLSQQALMWVAQQKNLDHQEKAPPAQQVRDLLGEVTAHMGGSNGIRKQQPH